MYIDIKPRRGRNDRLYIFNFKDKDEIETYIDEWLKLAKEHQIDDFKNIVLILKGRIDDKYATEDNQFSGLLFEDEFASFTTYIIILNSSLFLQREKMRLETKLTTIFSDENYVILSDDNKEDDT